MMVESPFPDTFASMTAAERRRWNRRLHAEKNRQAFVEGFKAWLLDGDWQWFGCLTKRSWPRIEKVQADFDHWRRRVNRRIWGRRYWRYPELGIHGFVVHERQGRGDWHSHFLARNTQGVHPRFAVRFWNQGSRSSARDGDGEDTDGSILHRLAVIERYDGVGAVSYCTKRLTGDEPEVIWNLF